MKLKDAELLRRDNQAAFPLHCSHEARGLKMLLWMGKQWTTKEGARKGCFRARMHLTAVTSSHDLPPEFVLLAVLPGTALRSWPTSPAQHKIFMYWVQRTLCGLCPFLSPCSSPGCSYQLVARKGHLLLQDGALC